MQDNDKSYWLIKADGSGLKQLQEKSSELARYHSTIPVYSLKQLNAIAYNYYEEWGKNKDKEIPALKLPAAEEYQLIIHLSFSSGNWANSVSVKTTSGERLLLECINNW